MIDLGSWMNKILIGWGVDPKIANTFDETIIAILMIFIAVGLDYLGVTPIRGTRYGGGSETMDVKVRLDQAKRQMQK